MRGSWFLPQHRRSMVKGAIFCKKTRTSFSHFQLRGDEVGFEGFITAALESYLSQVWIFRFPNVVGSRASHGAIYDFFRKLEKSPAELEVLGDGSQEKPYLHVGELLDAMLLAMEKSRDKLNYFNIGQEGSTSTVRFMAETVVKHLAPGARIRYTGGKKGWVGDVPSFGSLSRRSRHWAGGRASHLTNPSNWLSVSWLSIMHPRNWTGA